MVTGPIGSQSTPFAPWQERLIGQIVYFLITDQEYRNRAIELLIYRSSELAQQDPEYWDDLKAWYDSLPPVPPEEQDSLEAMMRQVLKEQLGDINGSQSND